MADETGPESAIEEHERRYHRHERKYHKGWHGGPVMGGPIWAIGWLFTIGYLHMPFFWKGVLAVIIWPFYLGGAMVH
jgi:hypothetical protein